MRKRCSGILVLLGLLGGCLSAGADEAADFYRGRTVTLIVTTSPGGDYDTRARLVAKHIGKHIPGTPSIVVQNMPGAGGLRGTNYVYNSAARDGSVLVAFEQQIALSQALGTAGVQYDLTQGAFIGNTANSPIVIVSWHTSPVKTAQDALREELVLGATGAGSGGTQVPHMLNAVIGTKFKVVLGYPGGNEIYVAMERGEVAGRGTQNWAGWKAQRPDWLRDGKLNLLFQGGEKAHPEISQVPLLVDFAKTAEDRELLMLFLTPDALARPLAVGPQVPAGRVAALRRAFDQTMADPEFRSDAAKARLEIANMTGEQADAVARRMLTAPRTVIERAQSFVR